MKQIQLIIFGILVGLLAAGLVLIIDRPSYGKPISLSPAPTSTKTSYPKPTQTKQPIMAQIKGEIKNPGIYEILEDSRLGNLLESAGGLTDNADLDRINYALRIRDGDYIYIPSIGESIPEIARNSPSNSISEQESLIQYPLNLNEATQIELESLPGIGPAKAADIIEYREMIGAFSTLEDLLKVSGIGPATLEALIDYLVCEP